MSFGVVKYALLLLPVAAPLANVQLALVQLAGSWLSLKSTTMRPSGRTTPVTVNCTSVMPVALTMMSLNSWPVVVAAIVMVTSALSPAARLVGAPVTVNTSLEDVTLMPSKVAWPVLAMVKVFVVAAVMTPKSREAGCVTTMLGS